MTRRIALLAVCCVISAGCGFSSPPQTGGTAKTPEVKSGPISADDAEKWTVREMLDSINAKGGKFRLRNYKTLAGELAYITELSEDSPRYDDNHGLPWLRTDSDYVQVQRMETAEAARLEVGNKEPAKVWRWKQFVFTAPDASKGASGRLKALLGG